MAAWSIGSPTLKKASGEGASRLHASDQFWRCVAEKDWAKLCKIQGRQLNARSYSLPVSGSRLVLGPGLSVDAPVTTPRHGQHEHFAELLRHYHARSGKTISASAQLAGISNGYLNDLFSGRRWRIRWTTLYVLCAEVWRVADEEGKALLWLRHRIEHGAFPRTYLTKDLVWQFAARGDMRTIACQLGLDYSYLLQIMSGRRRPTVQVIMSIYQHLGLDPVLAARLYTNDVRNDWLAHTCGSKQNKTPNERANVQGSAYASFMDAS